MEDRESAEVSGIDAVTHIVDHIGRVIVGKEAVVRLLLTTLVADGHALLVDVPGVAKTRLARALAQSLALRFSRIQGTPDLLPGDVIGVSVFDPRTQDFHYRPGPVLNHVVLVDEINRATPRTQAALLECMEERQVTVDGVSYPVPEPFFVMATENPVEMEGTYPLPEAQLDRFLLATSVGYPEAEEEREMVSRMSGPDPLRDLKPVVGAEEVLAWRAAAASVILSAPVRDYLVDIVRATRSHPGIRLGASPRAAVAFARAVRAWAWLSGRRYVVPDDVKALAVPVLAHRVLVAADADVIGRAAADLIREVLETIPVPTEVPA